MLSHVWTRMAQGQGLAPVKNRCLWWKCGGKFISKQVLIHPNTLTPPSRYSTTYQYTILHPSNNLSQHTRAHSLNTPPTPSIKTPSHTLSTHPHNTQHQHPADFLAINAAKIESNELPFSTARNAAAGA